MKIGYFGKLPGYGDFVQRNVSPALMKYFDNWILQSIEMSRSQLRESWQQQYFNSPIWRFVISANVICDKAITGFMMPSVDKAGRCYPFIVVCHADNQVNALTTARKLDQSHEKAEEFVLGLLDKVSPNLDDITNVLTEIYLPCNEADLVSEASVEASSVMELGCFTDHHIADFATCNDSFLESVLLSQHVKLTLWWMVGGVGFLPQKRYFSGMPPVEHFHTFILGAES